MYVDISLDRPRKLRFDIAAYRRLETALNGVPLGDVVSGMQRMGINVIVTTLWVGLSADDKSLSQNLTATILNDYLEGGGNIRVVIDAINKAFNESGLFKNIADPDSVEGNDSPEQPTVSH